MKLLGVREKTETRIDLPQVLYLLKLTLTQLDYSFLCLDALDELVPQALVELLKALHAEFSTTRIFLTGRPRIKETVNDYLRTKTEDAITLEANSEDIRKYLQYQIQTDYDLYPEEMSPELEDEILNLITERSEGMYVAKKNSGNPPRWALLY